MANEISHATLQSNGGQVASVLSDLVVEQLFDPTDLRMVMNFRSFASIVGSDTMDVTKTPVPSAYSAASSETAGGQSNTAFTTGKFQLAIARYVLQYQITDLLGIAGGPIDLAEVLRKTEMGVALTFTDLVTTLFASLANNVGPGSGVNLDVDSVYDAMYQLNSSNVPNTPELPWVCVLHPVQMNDFRNSLRSETGAMQFVPTTADMLGPKGPGVQGSWNGVRFIQSDSCPQINTSADRSGAMFGLGCFEWTVGPVSRLMPHINPGDVLPGSNEFLLIERNRDATNGMTSAIGNIYPAVAEREDLRGVEIQSDA